MYFGFVACVAAAVLVFQFLLCCFCNKRWLRILPVYVFGGIPVLTALGWVWLMKSPAAFPIFFIALACVIFLGACGTAWLIWGIYCLLRKR